MRPTDIWMMKFGWVLSGQYDQSVQPRLWNHFQFRKMGIKRQVQVAGHTSAKVIQNSKGMVLRFSPASSMAGK